MTTPDQQPPLYPTAEANHPHPAQLGSHIGRVGPPEQHSPFDRAVNAARQERVARGLDWPEPFASVEHAIADRAERDSRLEGTRLDEVWGEAGVRIGTDFLKRMEAYPNVGISLPLESDAAAQRAGRPSAKCIRSFSIGWTGTEEDPGLEIFLCEDGQLRAYRGPDAEKPTTGLPIDRNIRRPQLFKAGRFSQRKVLYQINDGIEDRPRCDVRHDCSECATGGHVKWRYGERHPFKRMSLMDLLVEIAVSADMYGRYPADAYSKWYSNSQG